MNLVEIWVTVFELSRYIGVLRTDGRTDGRTHVGGLCEGELCDVELCDPSHNYQQSHRRNSHTIPLRSMCDARGNV